MIKYPKPYAEKTLKTKYKQLGLEEETVQLLHRYFSSFANLYGILSLKDAYKIIKKQNPKMISFEKLYAFSEILRREIQYYYIVDMDEMWTDVSPSPENREIVAQDLLIYDEHYYELVKMQSGKPLYIPEKDELLKYEDELYYERTPYAVAVEQFFINKKKISEEELVEVMLIVTCGLNSTSNFFELMLKSFKLLNIKFISNEELIFNELVSKMNNHFRMRCNRGYTPTEISEIIPKSDKPQKIELSDNVKRLIKNGTLSVTELRNDIIDSADLPAQTKLDLLAQLAEIKGITRNNEPKSIAKNAPCPCGSGKKYKRCCGKATDR